MPGRPPGQAVAVLLLASLLPFAQAAPAAEMKALRPLVRAGEKAPGFALRDVDGGKVVFRPGGGKPSLVVFWSVFCPTCREIVPGIDRLSGRDGSGVRIVGVNLDGKRFANAIRSFLKEADLRSPVGLDDLRGDFFIASDPYGVEKTPTVVFVDGGGVVRGAWAGEDTRDFLKNADAVLGRLKKGAPPGKLR